jgi:hypothetical protein
VAATGGTVATSGDFKIHSFTGDGCFVVSNAGLVTPSGGSDKVDYLVVAGGGLPGYGTLVEQEIHLLLVLLKEIMVDQAMTISSNNGRWWRWSRSCWR